MLGEGQGCDNNQPTASWCALPCIGACCWRALRSLCAEIFNYTVRRSAVPSQQTLMDVLAGRKTGGTISGEVHVNGELSG